MVNILSHAILWLKNNSITPNRVYKMNVLEQIISKVKVSCDDIYFTEFEKLLIQLLQDEQTVKSKRVREDIGFLLYQLLESDKEKHTDIILTAFPLDHQNRWCLESMLMYFSKRYMFTECILCILLLDREDEQSYNIIQQFVEYLRYNQNEDGSMGLLNPFHDVQDLVQIELDDWNFKITFEITLFLLLEDKK